MESSLSAWQVATFAALLAAVIGLWIGPRAWWVMLGVATLLGYVAGVLVDGAAVWIAVVGALCWSDAAVAGRDRLSKWRLLTATAVVIAALLLGMHLLTGFRNPLVLDGVRLTPDSSPYTLYLNFDKTLAGILLLGVAYRGWPGIVGLKESFQSSVLWLILANIAILIGASLLLGYVRFDPKWTSLFWLWAAVNLFSVCLSEEAFFRGFVQRNLQSIFEHWRYGRAFALASGALLFGAAHFAGGWRYVALSTLAGLGYGYVYQRTQRIEWSMATHFALNTVHFLLFSYPSLA